jgi:hypothetical protein
LNEFGGRFGTMKDAGLDTGQLCKA